MKYKIGDYEPYSRSVPVRFEHQGVVHVRAVNACLAEDGSYDRKATAARVEEVARGVQHKIEAGLFGAPSTKG